MIAHWLNRTLTVWRPSTSADGSGGQTVTFTSQGTVAAKVDQPSAAEQQVAFQEGAKHTHNIYLDPDAGVRRNDELRGGGQVFRVFATLQPSEPRYLKALCELVEAGG